MTMTTENEPIAKQDLYLVGVHPYCFRAGTPAKIIGFQMVTPDIKLDPRPCFVIQFHDGFTEHVPFESYANQKHYKLCTFEDILTGRMPRVTS